MQFVKYNRKSARRFELPLIRAVPAIIIEDTAKMVEDIEGFVNVDLSIISDPTMRLNTLRVLITTRILLIAQLIYLRLIGTLVEEEAIVVT